MDNWEVTYTDKIIDKSRTNYLLTVLAEECAEVAQACSKSLRFGLDNYSPAGGPINREKIVEEFCDILATLEMLLDNGDLPTWSDDKIATHVEAKKAKVKKYMERYNNL